MTVVDVLGSVDELADGMGGSVDAVTGAAIDPYRKSRLNATLYQRRDAFLTYSHPAAVKEMSMIERLIKSWSTYMLGLSLAIAAITMLDANVASAFPLSDVQPGGVFQWISGDESTVTFTRPQAGQPNLEYRFPVLINGRQSVHIVSVPFANDPFVLKDHKVKDGRWVVTDVTGDPLVFLAGMVNSGSGFIDILAPAIEELFPVSRVSITLVSGTLDAAITLPGDQLVGPDGNDTFIRYTTTWSSFDPIGLTSEGDPIVLGEFTLNSVARPSSFFYSLDGASGHATFTIGENLILSTGVEAFGVVTKELHFEVVPEPSSLTLFSLGLFILFARWLPIRRR